MYISDYAAEFFGLDNMIPSVLREAASSASNVVDEFSVNDVRPFPPPAS